MSVVALDTHLFASDQKYSPLPRRHDEVISSGYSSQDGEVLLAVTTNFSTEDTSTKTSPHQTPSRVLVARKTSTSPSTQVSDYDGTSSAVLKLSPNHLLPLQSSGEVSRATSTMMSPRRCVTPTCPCCQRSDLLSRINEDLVQQVRQLEERNQGLSEEIQVSRRFYQGAFADLTAQLSIAENRIKYLKEVVSTQDEALQSRANNKERETSQWLASSGNSSNSVHHFTQPQTVAGTTTGNGIKSSRNNYVITKVPRSTIQHGNSSTASTEYHSGGETGRSTATSIAGSVASESSRSRLNIKNLARIKEQLLEKNQNLKTDIELLKFETDLPRSVSVPSLVGNRVSQELPAINSNTQLTGDKREDQQSGVNHKAIVYNDRQHRHSKNHSIYSQSSYETQILPEQKKKLKTRQK